MKWILVLAAASALTAPAAAQVKDSHGNPLHVGQPAKGSISDYNGGTIGRGRSAECVVDDEPRTVCTFFPRNGNGSFAIDVDGRVYYADLLRTGQITVDYDNGARMVPQGRFVRSKRNRACWVQGTTRRICVY